MTYTREQLEEMSDFEVNKALAKMVCKTHITYTRGHGEMVCVDGVNVDYCNNWSDIMPLAVEYKISLDTVDGGLTWWAGHDVRICENTFVSCCALDYQHASPQRAIACCLIMLDLGAKARGEV